MPPIEPNPITWELRIKGGQDQDHRTAMLTARATWNGLTYSGQGATAQEALDGLLFSIGATVRP